MRLHRRRRRHAAAVCTAALLALTARAGRAEPEPEPTPVLPGPFTVRDDSMYLPPLTELAPELVTVPRLAESAPAQRATRESDSPLKWQFSYQRSRLDTVSSKGMRTDPTTGFSRQLDRDVLELGMSWRLAGSRIGLGYELQAAREGLDEGFTRFLPGSANATHAVTLGVSREFGRGAPPPPPAPPLGLLAPTPLAAAEEAPEAAEP